MGIAADKKPAGPRNSFIIRRLSLSLSLSLNSLSISFFTAATTMPPLSQISVSLMSLVNYRLVLPFRRASATFIYRCAPGFIAYANSAERPIYRIIPIAGLYRCPQYRRQYDHVTNKRCYNGASETSIGFKCFRTERQKIKQRDNRSRQSPVVSARLKPDTTSDRFGASCGIAHRSGSRR